MTKYSGRDSVLKIQNTGLSATVAFTKIGACRTKTLNINNSPVDVSSDDSDWQEMLADGGVQNMDLSVDGLVSNNDRYTQLEAASVARTPVKLQFAMTHGSVFEGDYVIENLQMGAPHNDAITFSCSFKSTGEITYTPPV